MICSFCQKDNAQLTCADCHRPVCSECSISCQVCGMTVCREDVQTTSRSRKLCGRCMADRNARLAARQRRAEASGQAGSRSKDARHGAAAATHRAQTPAARPSEPSAKKEAEPAQSTSFEDLQRELGEPAQAAPETADREPPPAETDEGGEKRLEEAGAGSVSYASSGRLILPPIDEARPILTGSGYHPPSRTAYAIAYFLFGLAGIFFISRSDAIQDVIWPFDYSPVTYMENQMTPVQSTNALRGSSNVKQLDVFQQGPIFFTAWTILILYFTGAILIIVSTVRSAVSTYRGRRWLKKQKAKGELPHLGDTF